MKTQDRSKAWKEGRGKRRGAWRWKQLCAARPRRRVLAKVQTLGLSESEQARRGGSWSAAPAEGQVVPSHSSCSPKSSGRMALC